MNRSFGTLIFLLLAFFAIPQYLMAQNSIVTEINEPYLERLISTAKANYPRVKSLDNRLTMAKSNVSRTKLSYLDALTVSYVYTPNNTLALNVAQPTVPGATSSPSTNQSLFNGTQFGVFFNIGSYLAKPYVVRQAKQELEIANNEKEEYLLTLTTQVRKRYYVYVQRLAALKLQAQVAIDGDNSLKDLRYRFEKGEETLDSYTKARITQTQQNQAKISAEADLFLAKADLEELLGEKLENIR
jgi:outer membrane protein TolC